MLIYLLPFAILPFSAFGNLAMLNSKNIDATTSAVTYSFSFMVKTRLPRYVCNIQAIRFGFDSTAGLNFDLGFSLQLTEILSESN